MVDVRPTAMNELTSLFARAAVSRPRTAKQTYMSSMAPAPNRPVSSAMAEKMKSLSTTGICSAKPLPMPTPNMPPSAML